MDIILYLLPYIQYQQRIIRYLFSFVCRYIPLKQWVHDAVDGAISPEQATKLRQCLAHIDELEVHRKEIEQEILLLAEPISLRLVPTCRCFHHP